MPNGDPDWAKNELPKLEAFFSKISKVLEDFASTYNLMIDKYYHQGRDWTFRFRHPKGGVGGITVKKSSEEQYVWIGAAWSLDDYDKCTRSIKHTKMEKCSIEGKVLNAFLNKIFKTILSWQKEDLSPLKCKYADWRKQWTREEFECKDERYPTPKLH